MEYIKSNHLDNTAYNHFVPEAKKDAIFNTINTLVFIGGLAFVAILIIQESKRNRNVVILNLKEKL